MPLPRGTNWFLEDGLLVCGRLVLRVIEFALHCTHQVPSEHFCRVNGLQSLDNPWELWGALVKLVVTNGTLLYTTSCPGTHSEEDPSVQDINMFIISHFRCSLLHLVIDLRLFLWKVFKEFQDPRKLDLPWRAIQ